MSGFSRTSGGHRGYAPAPRTRYCSRRTCNGARLLAARMSPGRTAGREVPVGAVALATNLATSGFVRSTRRDARAIDPFVRRTARTMKATMASAMAPVAQ